MKPLPIALALALAACSASPSPERSLADAQAALAAGQPRAARIALLNLLQADPHNGAARLLQAETLLALGDGIGAESEVLRARESGIVRGQSAHLLAHALVLQGRNEEAIAEAAAAAPRHTTYALRMDARARSGAGDGEGAGRAFQTALAFDGEDVALWTDIGHFRRANGDIAGALAAADQAVARAPNYVPALILRGELTRAQYGLAAALPWFDRALEVDSHDVTALLERAATLGDLGRMRAMLADTRAALSLEPGNARAFHLQAVLAARAGDFALARALQERTGGAFDAQPAGMLLASAIDLQTGNAERAAWRLARLIDAQPANAKARRMLAAAAWRMGDVDATIAALAPLAGRADADAYSLTLMGQALERRGEAEAAAAYLARAAAPQGVAALAQGPVDDLRLAALRRDAALNPGEAPSEIALISALLGRGLGGEAMMRAARLQAAHPGAPEAHMLMGDARGTSGDFAGAAEEYRRAANLSFTEPVAMRLIEALQRSGQDAAAGQVLDLFLAQNPRNIPRADAGGWAGDGGIELGGRDRDLRAAAPSAGQPRCHHPQQSRLGPCRARRPSPRASAGAASLGSRPQQPRDDRHSGLDIVQKRSGSSAWADADGTGCARCAERFRHSCTAGGSPAELARSPTAEETLCHRQDSA